MNKRALDVDDLLAAFTPHAHSFFGKQLETKLDYWSVPHMDSVLGQGWFSKIAPVKEFWETIPTLSAPSSIDFDFDYYISSFPQDMYDVRVEWLKKNGFPDKPLIVTNDKLNKCLQLGVGLIVDDKPEFMKTLQDSPVRGIHFITHYAGFEPVGKYVTSLSQVKQYL